MLAAVVAGPILAVQAQQLIDRARQYRERQMEVFTILVATRAERTSQRHVQALNLIDLVFHGRRWLGMWRRQSLSEKGVVDAWTLYRDHLNHHPNRDLGGGDTTGDLQTGSSDSRQRYEAAAQVWFAESDRLLIELLHSMACCVGFNFDKTLLKRAIYRPEAHGTQDFLNAAIVSGLADVLHGKRSIRVDVAPTRDSDASPPSI